MTEQPDHSLPDDSLLRRVAQGAATPQEVRRVVDLLNRLPEARERFDQLAAGDVEAADMLEGLRKLAAADRRSRPVSGDVRRDGDGAAGPIADDATLASPLAQPHAAFPRIPGFQVTARLGQGGMGVVYQAVQLATHRQVALKVMRADMLASHRASARFEREVELAARLEHPHIARVYDSGTHGDLHFYAMEQVEGVHLDEYVGTAGLSLRQILSLMRTVCQAIHFAHQHGVIHRDIKPSNVLVDAEGEPHVVDFGLARALLAQDPAVTISVEGDVAGTPAYMSPEQAAGHIRQVDTRSDVYSLGVMLFQLVVGHMPHDAQTQFGLLKQIIEEDVRRPRSLSSRVDRELEAILLKALAREPERRYDSAGSLATDIDNYLKGEPLLARPSTTLYFLGKRVRKHWPVVATAAMLLVILLVMAAYSYVRVSRERAIAVAARQDAEEQRSRAQTQAQHARFQAARAESEALRVQQAAYPRSIALTFAQWRRGKSSRVRRLLDDCPAELRNWEWRFLDCVADQSVATITGMTERPDRLLLSPDGDLAVCIGVARTVAVFDLAQRRLVHTLDLPVGNYGGAAFMPDGERLAVTLCEVTASESADGRRRLAPTDRNGLFIVHLRSGELSPRLSAERPTALAMSADGVSLLAAGPSSLTTVDPVTGAAVDRRLLSAPDRMAGRSLYARLIDPAGRRVMAADAGGTIFVLRPGLTCLTLNGHTDWINHVALDRDGGRVATAGDDGTACVWDLATGNRLLQASGHNGKVRCAVFDPQGTSMVTTGWNGVIRVIDAATGRLLRTFHGHDHVVHAAAYTADGRWIVSVGEDLTLKVWDLWQQANPLSVPTRSRQVSGIVFSTDGRYVAAKSQFPGRMQVEVFDAASGQPHDGASAMWSMGGRLMGAQTWNGLLDLRSVESGRPQITVTESGQVIVRDAGGEAVLARLDGHGRPVLSMSLSADGARLLTADNSGEVMIWDLTRAALMARWHHGAYIFDAALSPDGHRAITAGDDGQAVIWDTDTGDELLALDDHPGSVFAVAFSPDGSRIATGSTDGVLRVWAAVPPPAAAP